MNSLVNYILEANVCLVVFITIYFLWLRNETSFSFNRGFLIGALLLSMALPLFHLQSESSSRLIPSVSQAVPAYLLPEVLLTDGESQVVSSNIDVAEYWAIASYVYVTGVVIFSIIFIFQLARLLSHIIKVDKYRWNNCLVAESQENEPTFSFFKFIFIGQAGNLREEEKLKILQHESIHADLFHSLDILLINLISIIFWFNPLVRTYKRKLVQLHEFEADKCTVEKHDVNSYCNLLAKVAMQSADYKLANHFNKSLTLKRIIMMKTIKKKIKDWKLVAIAATLPLIFFFIACQDQVMEDMKEMAQNSTMALEYPKEVQMELERLQKENPDGKFNVIEMNEEGAQKIKDLEEQYGSLPASISVINPVIKGANGTGYAILDFNQQTNQMIDATVGEDEVFSIVEEQPEPVGGMKQFYQYITESLQYPAEAKNAGIEGKVYVQFVIQEDGSLHDVAAIKGIGGGCDEEAVRVIEEGPNWVPGKQRGKNVRVRMVMPIAFRLGTEGNSETINSRKVSKSEVPMTVDSKKSTSNGKTRITGTVRTVEGKPLAGANIVLAGNTIGTVSDRNGEFMLSLDQASGQLAVSFIGYKTQLVPF